MGTIVDHLAKLRELEAKKKELDPDVFIFKMRVKSYAGNFDIHEIAKSINAQLHERHWPFKDEDLIEIETLDVTQI